MAVSALEAMEALLEGPLDRLVARHMGVSPAIPRDRDLSFPAVVPQKVRPFPSTIPEAEAPEYTQLL